MPLFLKRHCPHILVLFLAAVVFFTGFSSGVAPAHAASNPKYASLIMDADTGLILYQRYADKKVHPASLTKVMTLLMLFDALDQRRVSLNDQIRISKHAAGMSPSKIGLPAGSTIRVEDAIFAMVTKSANDIAAAVAEHLGGTESQFAKMMTRRAKEIGMSDTQFKNASGLHDPGQITTARDMAKMAQYVIRRYPQYYAYYSTENFTYRGKSYHNHNRMLGKYKGMDGMKTGYIAASGFNLIASVKRGDRRLIGIVFGGRTAYTRNAHMEELLDNSFKAYKDILVAQADVPVPGRKPFTGASALAANTESGLNNVTPAAGNIDLAMTATPGQQSRWTALNPQLQQGKFGELIGEGDFDPAISKRIETGLIAIAAHRGQSASYSSAPSSYGYRSAAAKAAPAASRFTTTKASVSTTSPRNMNSTWGIQIGAFSSRAASDQALHVVKSKLPADFSGASPIIAPLKTPQGYIFRARLSGLSAKQAEHACGNLLKDCLILAPNAY